MDLLSEIIECLNFSEEKKFRKFLEQKRFGKNCKRLQLLQLMQQSEKASSDKIMKEMYETKNTAAFFQLRRSLTSEAELFICQHTEDGENELYTMRLITAAKFLFAKSREKAGWKYLLKAEEIAIESEQYELLNLIYRLQLERSASEFAPSIESILQKRKQNLEVIHEMDELIIADSRLQANQDDKSISKVDISHISDEVNKKIERDQENFNKPAILYKLTMVERWKMLQQKDFTGLEKYLASRYEEMESKGMFNRHNHNHKVDFLLMITYNLLRNQKYAECEQYLPLLNKEIGRYESKATVAHRVTFMLMSTELNICLGKLKEASAIMDQLTQQYFSCLSGEYLNYYYTNSIIISFSKQDFSAVKHHLSALTLQSNKYLMRHHGDEALMKRQLIECLIYWETGDNDYVSYRLKSFERKYGDLIQKRGYEREKRFFNIFKVANLNRWIFDTGRINEEIEAFLNLKPTEASDIEFISLNAWLASKILSQNYYQTYVELLNGSTVPYLHSKSLKESA